MNFADLILATDKKTKSLYIKKYPFISKKIKIIPTGIDLDFFSISKTCLSQNNPGIRKELIYIGRLDPPKLLFEILKAFQIVLSIVPNSHFSIAGTGSLHIFLKQLVIKMGVEDNVSFLGILSKTQVRELIRVCL